MKRIIRSKDNMSFEIHVAPIGCHMAEINLYKIIRPHWKIFRTAFFPETVTVFIDDFKTFKDAIDYAVWVTVDRLKKEQERQNKWSDFKASSM